MGARFKMGDIELADGEACQIWAEAWFAGICTEPERPVLEAAAIYTLCEAFERAPLYAE
jgi:hypothetical protein